MKGVTSNAQRLLIAAHYSQLHSMSLRFHHVFFRRHGSLVSVRHPRFYTRSVVIPRHAVITGGSRGIGLAIARILASHSFRVTLISRSFESLEAAKATLPTPHADIEHNIVPGDVSRQDFWDSLVDGKIGTKVDVLVNCAGIAQNALLVRTPPALLDDIVRTNLNAVMLGVRALVKSRKLRRAEGDDWNPVVINLASLLALKGGRGAVAYSASKAGILGLTHALCAELGPLGVRVNAIVPGYVETDMTKDMSPSAREQILNTIPLKRFGQPDEIAEAALFLATNQYANNCVINLDGGLSAV